MPLALAPPSWLSAAVNFQRIASPTMTATTTRDMTVSWTIA